MADHDLDSQLKDFLDMVNVSTREEARKLPAKTLIAANYNKAWQSLWGKFTYAPAVDGDFIPEWSGKLLLDGKHAADYDRP